VGEAATVVVASMWWSKMRRTNGSRLTSVKPTPGVTSVKVNGVVGPLTGLSVPWVPAAIGPCTVTTAVSWSHSGQVSGLL